jgi:hypothetical protein
MNADTQAVSEMLTQVGYASLRGLKHRSFPSTGGAVFNVATGAVADVV